MVRIFAIEQVDLLESSTIGLNTRETAHVNNSRSYSDQLILSRLKLTGGLKHITINETELYSSFHLLIMNNV